MTGSYERSILPRLPPPQLRFHDPAARGEQEEGVKKCLRLSNLHVSTSHRVSRKTFLRDCRRAESREVFARVLDKTRRRHAPFNCSVVGLLFDVWAIVHPHEFEAPRSINLLKYSCNSNTCSTAHQWLKLRQFTMQLGLKSLKSTENIKEK